MKNRVLIAVVAILVAAPVVADLLQESEMATGWTALPVNGSVRLVHPGGAVRSVRAPAGGRVADVASVGDGWTLADCALVPMFFFLDSFAARLGIEVYKGRPKLRVWRDATLASELGKESEATMQVALEAFTAARAS